MEYLLFEGEAKKKKRKMLTRIMFKTNRRARELGSRAGLLGFKLRTARTSRSRIMWFESLFAI